MPPHEGVFPGVHAAVPTGEYTGRLTCLPPLTQLYIALGRKVLADITHGYEFLASTYSSLPYKKTKASGISGKKQKITR